MRLILGGNAGAVVRHGKHRLFTRAEYRHMDMTALRRILHGILHQIVHHLLQLRAVRRQQQTFRKVGGEPLSALFRHGLQTAQGGLCQLAQVEAPQLQRHGVAIHAGEGQQVVNDAGQPVDLMIHVLHEFRAKLCGHIGLGDQALQHDL